MTEQPAQDPNQPQPGWYADPGGDQTLLRWWDGRGWTAQTQPVPGVSGPQQPYPGCQPRALQQRHPWQGQASWPQQPAFPSSAVTRRPLGILETCFHIFMTVMSFGLWGFVWWGRVRMRRSYTTFQ